MEKKKKKEDSLIKLDHGQLMIDLTDWANPVVILIQVCIIFISVAGIITFWILESVIFSFKSVS